MYTKRDREVSLLKTVHVKDPRVVKINEEVKRFAAFRGPEHKSFLRKI